MSNSFGATTRLYAAYIDVGGTVVSLYPDLQRATGRYTVGDADSTCPILIIGANSAHLERRRRLFPSMNGNRGAMLSPAEASDAFTS